MGIGRLAADRHPPKREAEPLGELRGSLGEPAPRKLGDVQNVAVVQPDGRPIAGNRSSKEVGHDCRRVLVPNDGHRLPGDIPGEAFLHANDGAWRHHLQREGVPEEHLPLGSNAKDKILGIGLLGGGLVAATLAGVELAVASTTPAAREEDVVQRLTALFQRVRHGELLSLPAAYVASLGSTRLSPGSG